MSHLYVSPLHCNDCWLKREKSPDMTCRYCKAALTYGGRGAYYCENCGGGPFNSEGKDYDRQRDELAGPGKPRL